jgi:hypothetical protein
MINMIDMIFFIVSSVGLFLADIAFSEQNSMAVNFKTRIAFYVILHMNRGCVVKMINFAAIRTLHVKMTLAFFVVDKLINKASAVTLDRAVNKTVFNKLCHESVCRTLADFFVHFVYDFFYCKTLIAVCLQKINQTFTLMSIINPHFHFSFEFENNS